MAETDDREPDGVAPRRGGCWKRSCGCGAFGLGALVVLVALAPRLAGGFVADVAADRFARDRAGELVVPAPALRWTSRQHARGVRLVDPRGRTVAEGSLELPSLLDLLGAWTRWRSGEGIELGELALTVTADVIVDEEGRTNLEAALALRSGGEGTATPEPTGSEPDEEEPVREDLLRRLAVELSIDCPRLTWTDPRLEVPEQRATLHGVRGRLVLSEGGNATLELSGEQECETRGPFSLEARLEGLGSDRENLPETWRGTLSAEGLSGALADRLGGQEGELGALLGESFSVAGAADGRRGDLEEARLDLRAEGMRLAAAGALDGTRFALVPESSVIELAPEVAAERIRAWGARALPEGISIETPEGGLSLEVTGLSLGFPTDAEDLLRELDLDLSLSLGPLSLRDPFQSGRGEVLSLSGLELSVELTAGEPPSARAKTGFTDQAGSFLTVEARAREPLSSRDPLEEAAAIALDVRVEAEGIPVDRLVVLAAEESPWQEMWGSRLSLEAEAALAEGQPTPLRLSARTDHADLALEGELSAERLRLTGSGLVGELRLPKHAVADKLRDLLPEGYVLSSREAQLPVHLRVEELQLDLAAAGEGNPLAGASLRADVTLGAIDYTETLLARGGLQVSVAQSEARVELFDGRLALDLDARLDVEGGGALRAHLESANAASLLDDSGVGAGPLVLRAEAVGFPTAVVDLYTEQNGLLVDVLGPRIDARAESDALTLAGGPLSVRASSDLGSFRWSGRYEEGVLVSGEAGELEASVGLTPLLGERIVGPLVPLLVDLEKPDAQPVVLRGTGLTLPLDGDLSRLEGKLRLELGRVTCKLLPGLGTELPGLLSKAIQSTDVEPIDLAIEKGVVRYDRLSIRIDGRPIVLAGSYDLARGSLDFSTSLRLGDVGGEVGRALRSVRKALGDDYPVPLRIGGTPRAPRVSLQGGFLERALKDAGEKAIENELEKGLRKIFGGGG